MRQTAFQKTNWSHRFAHGGSLRNKRAGRKDRPLSTKEPIHLVLKVNRDQIKGGFRTPKRFSLTHRIFGKYATRFDIKIEQISLQGDHIHAIVRTTRRSDFQNFLRVLSGQIAQQFKNAGLMTSPSHDVTDTPKLWKYRPFTRVIRGHKAYLTARNYVQLNELEAQKKIPYRKSRLKGVLEDEWRSLWG